MLLQAPYSMRLFPVRLSYPPLYDALPVRPEGLPALFDSRTVSLQLQPLAELPEPGHVLKRRPKRSLEELLGREAHLLLTEPRALPDVRE